MLKNFKMLMPMALVFGLRKYTDTSDPDTVFWFRIFFGVGQFLLISTLLYIYTRIDANPDGESTIRVSKDEIEPPNPMSKLLGGGGKDESKESKDGSEESEEEKPEMKICDYDKKLWWNKFRQQSLTLVIVPLIHWKFEAVIPLVMSVLLAIMNTIDDPLVRVYVLKQDINTHDDLKRPFKISGPFDAILNMPQQLQEAASISNTDKQSTDTNDKVTVEDDNNKNNNKKKNTNNNNNNNNNKNNGGGSKVKRRKSRKM